MGKRLGVLGAAVALVVLAGCSAAPRSRCAAGRSPPEGLTSPFDPQTELGPDASPAPSTFAPNLRLHLLCRLGDATGNRKGQS